MKTTIAILARAGDRRGHLKAQQTITAYRYGNTTTYSNGVSAFHYGNTTTFSNGASAYRYGNATTYHFPAPTTMPRYQNSGRR